MKKIKDIWFRLKHRLLPLASPDHDFIQWCKSEPPDNATNAFSLSSKSPDNPANKQQSAAFFEEVEKALNTEDGNTSSIDIAIDRHLSDPCSLVAHTCSQKKTIRNFWILGDITQPLKLDTLDIYCLEIRGNSSKKIIIENSKIARLNIVGVLQTELDIRNTYIGKLALHDPCIRRCLMFGGGITQLEIDPPGSVNPFTGSVWFANTWFPTDKNMTQGAQPYRNMRHHLRSLSNMQMADLFHALELRTERRQETWTNKVISYLYDAFSDFGASILRPVLWLLLLGVSVSYILITWAGAIPTHALESSAVGWQTTLLGNDILAPITRGFYLSFYSIVHPLGLFGGQPLLVASTRLLSGLLIIEGLFSATLIALTIFALRRRFKLQQS
jgi:hypothetical protein